MRSRMLLAVLPAASCGCGLHHNMPVSMVCSSAQSCVDMPLCPLLAWGLPRALQF